MLLPTGTVTFLFSDIEGSTRLVQALGERYGDVLKRHNVAMRQAIERADGRELGTEGDSFFVVFESVPLAVRCAVEAQIALASEPWPAGGSVRVRMGLHTGEAQISDDGYVGVDVNRAARIAGVAHGGQVLLSKTTASLVVNDLPDGVTVRDLGAHRLKDLAQPEQIFQLVIGGQTADFPPLQSLDARPHNLHRQPTSFIGREQELADTERVLREDRLITLTGPGGAGKTRLAMQLASHMIGEFEDGVFFVDLAPIDDPDLVALTVIRAIGLPESRGETRSSQERLVEYLRDREMLLILDNFEQVLPSAPLVSEVLEASPESKVVVTSRAALNLYGERSYPVPPLGSPDPRALPDLETLSQYAAVRLFIDRATAVQPGFAVTNENAPAVAEICARLDGLPLAIELAAARVRLLSPEAILARLGDRLSLLVGGPRDLPARQRTLRQAIAWSHDLLAPEEQRFLARLAVFVKGFRLEEAEAVCGPAEELGLDIFEGVATLVENSLVTPSVEEPSEPRFSMLEMIRDFARERLAESGEEDELRRRHATALLGLAEASAPGVYGPGRRRILDRLEREHDNFRAAMGWALSHQESETALRLATALWRLWQMRGYLREGRRFVEGALGMPDATHHPQARLKALAAAGGIAHWQMDQEGQLRHYEDAVVVARELGDEQAIADAVYDLCFPVYFGALIGEDGRWHIPPEDPSALERARTMWDEALGLYEGLGDRHGMARVRWLRGFDRAITGDLTGADDDLRFALEVFEELDDAFQIAWAHYGRANVDDMTGNYAAARRGFTEALRLFAEANDTTGVVFQLEMLAKVEANQGDSGRAARLAGAATALRAESGTELIAGFIDGVPLPEDFISNDETAEAWREGKAMRREAAVAYALDPVGG